MARDFCLAYENGDRIWGNGILDDKGLSFQFTISRYEIGRPVMTLSPNDWIAIRQMIAMGLTVVFTVAPASEAVC